MNSIGKRKQGEMEDWNTTFRIWNKCFFACKLRDLRAINRAVLDKILVEIRDKTRRNAGLEVCI